MMHGTHSKNLTTYGRCTGTATGVSRLEVKVYQGSDYGRITAMATGVSYSQQVWAYHGCDYSYDYRLATSVRDRGATFLQ